MAWNKTSVSMIEINHLRTKIIDEDRAAKIRKDNDGPPFALQIESLGPGSDGIEISIGLEDSKDKLCEFWVPDESWKTFVAAVKAVDSMWDLHEPE